MSNALSSQWIVIDHSGGCLHVMRFEEKHQGLILFTIFHVLLRRLKSIRPKPTGTYPARPSIKTKPGERSKIVSEGPIPNRRPRRFPSF